VPISQLHRAAFASSLNLSEQTELEKSARGATNALNRKTSPLRSLEQPPQTATDQISAAQLNE